MPLISLEEAARMLGYTAKGFRKIVDRSRAKAAGHRTHGPTIRFFQATKGASIKFKVEWIEAFVSEHTIDPKTETSRSNGRPVRSPFVDETAGLDCRFLDLLR
jgi:hypothetical protein